MRNLAGRLTARSSADLMRIAEFWQSVVYGRDRHAVVGQLYREMREVRSARDVWARLDLPEREIISLMALDDQEERSWTLPELAGTLGVAFESTRETAIGLYRKGLLYREGDDDELPVGELPKLFLPRELTSTFRRVHDEIDAGPLERVSFSVLLALLDETELEQAASFWGVEVQPGLQDRDDIARQLSQAVLDTDRRDLVIAGLSADGRRLWTLLAGREVPVAQLAEILNEAGITGEGLAVVQRQRNVVGELEDRLLAWHSYGQDESRNLFVPDSFREQRRHIQRSVAMPTQIETPPEVVGWNHPWAVPWDLLTLLREVSGRNTSPPAFTVIHQWQERLAGKLWNTGGDEYLANYLRFLTALGRNENVFQEEDEEGAPRPGRSWKAWRARSFPDQISHLIWWWTASPGWIEASTRSTVFVEYAALPQFRRKLLALMNQLEAGTWFSMGEVSRWVASIDPDILGDEAAIATAGALDVPPGHPGWSEAATATVVQEELESAFAWFGLIDMAIAETGMRCMRTTEMLAILQREGPIGDVPQPAGPAIQLTEDGIFELRAPSPVRVWSLSAFAELIALRPVAYYRITETSLRRALAEGPTLLDITGYLEAEMNSPLPSELRQQYQEWSIIDRLVQVRLTAEISTGSNQADDYLKGILREAGWELGSREKGFSALLPENVPAAEGMERVLGLLRGAGYFPNVKGPSELPSGEAGSSDAP